MNKQLSHAEVESIACIGGDQIFASKIASLFLPRALSFSPAHFPSSSRELLTKISPQILPPMIPATKLKFEQKLEARFLLFLYLRRLAVEQTAPNLSPPRSNGARR
jgi:hypothetical protein